MIVIAWIVSLIIATIFGGVLSTKGMKIQFGNILAQTQAIISYDNMSDFREIEGDLSKGCFPEALKKANLYKERNLDAISNYLKESSDPSFRKYISIRDPELIKNLQNHKSVYKNISQWPKCNK